MADPSRAKPVSKQYQGKIQGENQAWPENATAVCHFTPLLCGVPVKNGLSNQQGKNPEKQGRSRK